MLSHLQIENIALIDQLSIEFGQGLNIITGETGTGKSIVIDSINLLLGERADRDLIRAGKETAYIEGIFNLEDTDEISPILDNYGIKMQDGLLIITRELSATGRNICRINGRAVTLSILKEVSRHLVDIHGQHEHQSLLSIESHKNFLDSFGGVNVRSHKKYVKKYYSALVDIQNQIDNLQGVGADGDRHKDYLIYQLQEITSANLKEDEDRKLLQERTILQNSERIMESVENAYNLLYRGALGMPSIHDNLGRICSEFEALAEIDEELENFHRRLENIYYELEDCTIELRDYMDTFNFDEDRLEEIETRLDLINDLKRKYGKTIDEILEYRKDLENKLRQLEESKQLLDDLNKSKNDILKELYETSGKLSHERKMAAKEFQLQMLQQLRDLGMEKTEFVVDIKSNKNNISSDGFDKIEFLISPNPGEPLKPLSKIASGGEIGRIMLAFKTILADVDKIPTLIFDEIDVGISGSIAQAVAQKMAIISRSHQLICVTHLPQIAAMADKHFTIEKYTDQERTYTTARVLPEKERQYELAKMIDGTGSSKLSLDHALELIRNSMSYKKTLYDTYK